jgi:tRNA nucleotidyltransferase (CCA-adding enzyme)
MMSQSLTLVLTHENADFDAVASQLGAWLLEPSAVPVLPRRCNRNVRAFLSIYADELPFVEATDLPRRAVNQVVLVDTQGLVTAKGVTPSTLVHVLDHHPPSRELPQNWTYRGSLVGATTTLLVEELMTSRSTLTPVQATLLLLGIYEDTGALQYQTTTARDAHATAWLLECGANLSVVGEFLHHPLEPSQLELFDRLLASAQTHIIAGHSVVVAAQVAHGYAEEVSTLAHKLRDVLDPDALFVLVALDGSLQMVCRSRTDDIDVGVIATRFGGGGHSRAAAALIRDRALDDVVRELLDVLPQVVRPAVTVAQIMSRPVQTVTPDTPVAEAAERMRRTGHEGYPVVRDGRVVGLLTRRGVDRGMQHGLGNRPVERVMDKGEVFVTPDDPVEKLEQLMIEHGWGQVPVVEQGQVAGIVTRTDLIKLWVQPPSAPRREQVAARLEAALPAPLVALIRQIAATAHGMGLSIYFVGGLVRDLLLGFPIGDVDLVVEGDAIALAKELARTRGGRVKSHARFGTAKWLIADGEWQMADGRWQMADGRWQMADGDGPRGNGEQARPSAIGDMPNSIDFVTARTEFYSHPSALPQVERSSIKQDLHRRDFTINTLAICLDPDRWGELLDFYSGEQDLQDGVIRVLHSLSFVEDPTRMLRAVRFEQRLGFHIEPRTLELISHALDLLDRVSGDRVRHELTAIFHEARPEDALCRLRELGILKQIYVALTCDEWLHAKYARVRSALDTGEWPAPRRNGIELRAFAYLALLCYRLDTTALESVITRLKIPTAQADALRQVEALKRKLPELARRQKPSVLVRLLEDVDDEALFVAWAAAESKLAARQILHNVCKLRGVRPELDGRYLQSRGIKPGPELGRILDALRDALLDGEVRTRAEQEAFVQEFIARGT